MTKNNSNDIKGLPDLLSRMACGDYQDLQVFRSRAKMNDYKLPKDFLYVDDKSFGKVGLTDMCYCNETIYLDISDCHTCLSDTLCLDINCNPEFKLILWKDVVDMVREDNTSASSSDSPPLEFDFN